MEAMQTLLTSATLDQQKDIWKVQEITLQACCCC